jgi:hypothetical protein
MGGFSDIQDGTVFSYWDHDLEDCDIRLIVYWDGVTTTRWGKRVSTGVLRALPANYPRWMRSYSSLWWTLALLDEAAVGESTLDWLIDKIFHQLEKHQSEGDLIYDAFQGVFLKPKIQTIGTLGDLPARNFLFHFRQGSDVVPTFLSFNRIFDSGEMVQHLPWNSNSFA